MANPFDELLRGLPPSDMGGQVTLPQGAPKPKMNWGAIIADALSGLAGQQGQYPQRVARERAEEAERVNWGLKRQAELEDYGRKLEMQNDPRYAKPAAPYRWESNNGSLMEMGPDGIPRIAYADPTPKMNFIPDGMGGGRFVPLPGATSTPAPAGPQGVTFTPLDDDGGPPSASAGSFRWPY